LSSLGKSNCRYTLARIVRAREAQPDQVLGEAFEIRLLKAFGPKRRLELFANLGERLIAIEVAD
jgi:hypothetical protein